MRLIELTAENWREVMKLELHDNQNKYLESNLMTIAESQFYPGVQVKGMGNDEGMVGLVAYFPRADILDETLINAGFIMRFMIAKEHQGKGYGRILLEITIQAIQEASPKTERINLSVVPENEGAVGFYKKMGFVSSGRQRGPEDEYTLVL